MYKVQGGTRIQKVTHVLAIASIIQCTCVVPSFAEKVAITNENQNFFWQIHKQYTCRFNIGGKGTLGKISTLHIQPGVTKWSTLPKAKFRESLKKIKLSLKQHNATVTRLKKSSEKKNLKVANAKKLARQLYTTQQKLVGSGSDYYSMQRSAELCKNLNPLEYTKAPAPLTLRTPQLKLFKPKNCRQDSDPLRLANGSSVLLIDQNNCSCNDPAADDPNPRDAALDPHRTWCTLALQEDYFNHKLKPGDVVYLREGEYTISSLRVLTSGTESAPIRISAYPGDQVIIRGGTDVSQRGSAAASNPLITFLSSYLTLDSLHFIGNRDTGEGRLYSPNMLTFVSSKHVTLNNLSLVHNQGIDDVGYGKRYLESESEKETWGVALSFVYVDTATVTNTRVRCTETPELMQLDKLNGDGMLFDYSQNLTFTNNDFSDCGHQLLGVRYSSGITATDNYLSNIYHTCIGLLQSTQGEVSNNIFYGYNLQPSQSNYSANGIQVQGSSYFAMRQNLFANSANYAAGIALLSNTSDQYTHHNSIENNLIFNMGRQGLYFAGYGAVGATDVSNNTVEHNTIFGVNDIRSPGVPPGYSFISELVLLFADLTNQSAYGNIFNENFIKSFDSSGVVVKALDLKSADDYTVLNFNLSSFNQQTFAKNNF